MRSLCCLLIPILLTQTLSGLAMAKDAPCPFVDTVEVASALAPSDWTLISNQDGRGCFFQSEDGDTLMVAVFRNPDADRARGVYGSFRKTLGERMAISPMPGIGDETQAGATGADSKAARAEAAVVSLAGEYIVSINLYRSGRPAAEALVKPLAGLARLAIANAGKTSERFGQCEWLTAADAAGFLDEGTITLQRTGANSCMIYDGSGNTLMAALTESSSQTVMNMKERNSGCTHVPLLELGKEAFGEHSCSSGNKNAASIHVWKNGKDAWIVFAPTKPHAESHSVDRLKAVAGKVYAKM